MENIELSPEEIEEIDKFVKSELEKVSQEELEEAKKQFIEKPISILKAIKEISEHMDYIFSLGDKWTRDSAKINEFIGLPPPSEDDPDLDWVTRNERMSAVYSRITKLLVLGYAMLESAAEQMEGQAERDRLEKGLMRASMAFTKLELGRGQSKARQLLLGETQGEEIETNIGLVGMQYETYAQAKAMHAALRLLDATNYKGHMSREIVQTGENKLEDMGGKTIIPRIICTPSEFYEAYGLERKNGRFPRAQQEEAFQALQELGQTVRRLAWERKYRVKKKLKSDVIITESPIIRLTRVYKGLDADESNLVWSDKDLPGQRLTKLAIDFHFLSFDQIDSFYFLQETDLYKRVETSYTKLTGKKRGKKPVYPVLFTKYIRTLSKPVVKETADGEYFVTLKRETLAEQILPAWMIEQRKQSMIDEALALSADIAQDMDLITRWELAMEGLGYTFYINPEKSSRLKESSKKEEN